MLYLRKLRIIIIYIHSSGAELARTWGCVTLVDVTWRVVIVMVVVIVIPPLLSHKTQLDHHLISLTPLTMAPTEEMHTAMVNRSIRTIKAVHTHCTI